MVNAQQNAEEKARRQPEHPALYQGQEEALDGEAVPAANMQQGGENAEERGKPQRPALHEGEAVALEGEAQEAAGNAPNGDQNAPNGDQNAQKAEQNAQKAEQKPAIRKPVLFEAGEGENAKQVTALETDAETGEAVAVLADGSRAALEDAGLSPEQQELAQEAAELPQEAQAAMVEAYSPAPAENATEGEQGAGKGNTGRVSVRAYAQGFKRLFAQAALGMDAETMKSLFAQDLSKAQREAAIAAGRAEWEKNKQKTAANNRQAQQDLKRRGFSFRTLEEDDGTGGVYLARVEKPVTEAGAVQLAVINEIAREAGVRVRVYDSLNENGSYQTGSNIINVALDAEEGMLTRTASHELFHFIHEWSKEAGEKLKTFVLDALRQKGFDLESRIEKIQRQYQTESGKALSRADAEEEIAAEGVLDVIGDEQNLKGLFRDKSLTQKIADWLRDTAAKLKAAMQRIAWNHPEVRALNGDAAYLERVKEMFSDALAQAAQNYRAARRGLYEKAAADADVQSYLQGIEEAATAEDAKAEADALASRLFLRAEQGWIEQHPDQNEDGFERFKAAILEYAKGKTSLAKAFRDNGLDVPPQKFFSALAYTGRQLVATQENIKQTAPRFSQRAIDNLTEAEERDLLERVVNGEFADRTYIPLRKNTPGILISEVERYTNGETTVQDLPIIAEAGHLRQAMDEDSGSYNRKHRPHNISEDDMISIIKGMDYPAYIVLQENGRYVEVVKYHGEKGGKSAWAVLDFDGNINPSQLNGYPGGSYNIMVTAFEPDDLQHYLNTDGNEIIYEKAKDAESRGSNRLWSSHADKAPFAEDSVAQTEAEVKTEFPIDGDIKYSQRADTDDRQERAALEEVADDAELYGQMKSNGDAMAALQMLIQLHKLTTAGGESALIQKGAFEKRLSDIVDKITEQTGTKYGLIKLRNALRQIYQAMEKSAYSAGEILQYAREIMRDVLDKSPGVLVEQDETTRDVIAGLKNRKFYLTDDQKSEIKNTYGTISRFAQKNFGALKIVKRDAKTASLEDVWREDLSPCLPGTFAEDANPLDMPAILDAWLETAKEKKYAGEFGRNIGAYATDLALNAMLDFYDVPGALKSEQQIREAYEKKYLEQEETIRFIRQAAKEGNDLTKQKAQERIDAVNEREKARVDKLYEQYAEDRKKMAEIRGKARDYNRNTRDGSLCFLSIFAHNRKNTKNRPLCFLSSRIIAKTQRTDPYVSQRTVPYVLEAFPRSLCFHYPLQKGKSQGNDGRRIQGYAVSSRLAFSMKTAADVDKKRLSAETRFGIIRAKRRGRARHGFVCHRGFAPAF